MIAAWLRPLLWTERDWDRTLAQIAHAMAGTGDARAARAAELGAACEHVVPDRRRAIAAYASGGGRAELARARALAAAHGWWPAVARLALAERHAGGPPTLAIDELLAWLDAGEPGLAAMVAADARAAAPDDAWLAALDDVLRAGHEPAAVIARLEQQAGHDPRGLATAARIAALAGQRAHAATLVARAVTLAPGDEALGGLALTLVDDEDALHAIVRARLHDLEPAAWVDAARELALALVARPGQRGLGLRLVRAALALIHERRLPVPRGHLALWTVLVEHAAASDQRPALLGLAALALDGELPIDDRVWLAALGADIAWDDARALEVARAWAAAVAEHAPDHPSVRSIAHAALASLRAAAAHADDASVEVPLDDLHDPAPAPAATIAVLTAAVDAAALAIATTPTQPPAPAAPVIASLIPSSARSALGRLAQPRLPALPPPPSRPDALPRAPRVALPLDAVIERAGYPGLPVVCRDVSTTGVFVLTSATLVVGDTFALVVHTPTDEPWREQRHETRARVVRREARGYGLVLVAPPETLVAELARMST